MKSFLRWATKPSGIIENGKNREVNNSQKVSSYHTQAMQERGGCPSSLAIRPPEVAQVKNEVITAVIKIIKSNNTQQNSQICLARFG